MTHTEHYELSQWQKSDRLMMSDFNADNQKLDAALATNAALAANAPRLLLTQTLTQPRESWSLSLADIDLSPYRALRIESHLHTTPGGSSTVYLRFNNDAEMGHYSATGNRTTVSSASSSYLKMCSGVSNSSTGGAKIITELWSTPKGTVYRSHCINITNLPALEFTTDHGMYCGTIAAIESMTISHSTSDQSNPLWDTGCTVHLYGCL